MRSVRFEYLVRLVIELTEDELKVLTACCRHHYDLTVRGVAKPGKGAFLHGWRTELMLSQEYAESMGEAKPQALEVAVGSDELGLLTKALEWAPPLRSASLDEIEHGAELLTTMADLRQRLGQAQADVQVKYLEMNPERARQLQRPLGSYGVEDFKKDHPETEL